MKSSILIASVLVFILLISSSHAACPEPDIKVYSACTDKCPDAVSHTFAYANCINKCLAMWSKMQDDSAACGKAEREAEEKARTERENKLRGIEEAKVITVSTVEGMLWLTNPEGLVENIVPTNLFEIEPSSILRSDPDSTAVLTLKEGSRLQLGPDSQFTYIDGEPIIPGEPSKMKYTYKVSKGRVRYKSENLNVKYEVHTPTSTVVNRQTDFIVEVDPATNMTSIYLYDGILDVNTTEGEKFVLNNGEMISIDAAGKAVKSNLSMEDWDGMVNSLETGEEFIPSDKKQFTLQKVDMKVVYLISVMAAVLIVLIAVIVIRKKRSK